MRWRRNGALKAPTQMFLSPDELRELTARRMPSAQARVLAAMGVAFRRRPDGTLAVPERAVAECFGVESRREIEPNWSALDAAKAQPRKSRAA